MWDRGESDDDGLLSEDDDMRYTLDSNLIIATSSTFSFANITNTKHDNNSNNFIDPNKALKNGNALGNSINNNDVNNANNTNFTNNSNINNNNNNNNKHNNSNGTRKESNESKLQQTGRKGVAKEESNIKKNGKVLAGLQQAVKIEIARTYACMFLCV